MDKKTLTEGVLKIYHEYIAGKEIDKEVLRKIIKRFNELLNA